MNYGIQEILDDSNAIFEKYGHKPIKIPEKSPPILTTRTRSPSKEELYGSDYDLSVKNKQFQEKLKNVHSSGYGQTPKPPSQMTNSLGEPIKPIKWTNAVKLPRTKKTMPPLSCPNKKNEFNGRYL